MKKTIFLFAFISVLFIGCSKDDDSVANKNTALVRVTDVSGTVIPGVAVHAFSDYNWELTKGEEDMAEWIQISDEKGLAVFDNLNDEMLKLYNQSLVGLPDNLKPKTVYKEGYFRFVVNHQEKNYITEAKFLTGERRDFVIILK